VKTTFVSPPSYLGLAAEVQHCTKPRRRSAARPGYKQTFARIEVSLAVTPSRFWAAIGKEATGIQSDLARLVRSCAATVRDCLIQLDRLLLEG